MLSNPIKLGTVKVFFGFSFLFLYRSVGLICGGGGVGGGVSASRSIAVMGWDGSEAEGILETSV